MFDIASIIFWKFRRVWAGKLRLLEGVLGQPPRLAPQLYRGQTEQLCPFHPEI